MLNRGADGRLYRVGPNGALVVAEEAMAATVARAPARGTNDNGASAELFSASAELFSATI